MEQLTEDVSIQGFMQPSASTSEKYNGGKVKVLVLSSIRKQDLQDWIRDYKILFNKKLSDYKVTQETGLQGIDSVKDESGP